MTIEEKFAEDKVWEELSSALLGRIKTTNSRGFSYFNCPVCVQQGQPRHDTKHRCGVIYDNEGIGINCFNCGFKIRYKKGQLLSKAMERFLLALNVDEKRVKELYFWAWELFRLVESNPGLENITPTFFHGGFPTAELPPCAKPITQLAEDDCDDENFIAVVDYLMSRGDALVTATDYYWSPDLNKGMNRRLIIPFYYEDRIVGWTARTIDDIKPKYHNTSPPGYLFNCNVMKLDRKYLLLTEGVLDAIAIDCIGLQRNNINERQINWINACKQIKIVVPDRDVSGSRLIDIAMEQGWHVAFPNVSGTKGWWEEDIKDVADATKRYGRLFTLRSIIATATNNKTLIAINKERNTIIKKEVYDWE